jgi:hypothetical protein
MGLRKARLGAAGAAPYPVSSGIEKYSEDYTSDTPYATDGTTTEGQTLYKIEHVHSVGTTAYSVHVHDTDTGQTVYIYNDLKESFKYTIWFTSSTQNITITVIG